MDLYNTVLDNGGKIIDNKCAFREFTSKDGTKLIKQMVSKKGYCAIDVFEKEGEERISVYRKTMKYPNNNCFSAKFYNYKTESGNIFSFLPLKKNGEFVAALFKTGKDGASEWEGEFITYIRGHLTKDKVTRHPVGKLICEKKGMEDLIANFNRFFGTVERNVFF